MPVGVTPGSVPRDWGGKRGDDEARLRPVALARREPAEARFATPAYFVGFAELGAQRRFHADADEEAGLGAGAAAELQPGREHCIGNARC